MGPRDLLRRCTSPAGFLASPTERANYARVWARDGAVASLGALVSGEADLLRAAQATLATLQRHQAPAGQLPSNVAGDRVSYGTKSGRIDATAWWVVAVCVGHRVTGDPRWLDPGRWGAVHRAVGVLRAWEHNEGGLLYVPPAGDWADEYPVSGRLLMDNALYGWALAEVHAAAARLSMPPPELARVPAEVPLERLWAGDHYRVALDVDRPAFDALGNALALWRDPGGDHAEALCALARAHLDPATGLLPAFHPPITPEDADWDALVALAGHGFRNEVGHYHNGGQWPMVAGFWALAARQAGDVALADALHDGIRRANTHGFPEYLVAGTGAADGVQDMAWSAAAELLASPQGAARLSPPG